MIRTKDLSMQYGQLKALDGLNLEIGQGEFFAFLGPNAAGKTTTIKLLTGLLRPHAGKSLDLWTRHSGGSDHGQEIARVCPGRRVVLRQVDRA